MADINKENTLSTESDELHYYNRINALDINSNHILIATRTRGILSYCLDMDKIIVPSFSLKSTSRENILAYDITYDTINRCIYACSHSGQLYIWRDELENTEPILISTIQVSPSSLNRIKLLSSNGNQLVMGSEAGELFHLDCTTNKVMSVTRKKLGSILDMGVRDENTIWSVGEFGLLLRWDLRMSSCENIICPSELPALQRKERWLGCLDLTKDWIATGGGPKLAIFDQRHINDSILSIIDDDDIFPTVAIFDYAETGINLVAGGWSKQGHIKRYNLDGSLCERPLSTTYVPLQALKIKRKPYKLMVAGGNDDAIDIFFNFNYKSLTLRLCSNL